MANPFTRVDSGDYYEGAAKGMGRPASAPMAAPAQPTSRVPFQAASAGPSAMPGYSPLRDPEGPLARAGWIGALLATGPSKTDYLTAQEEQKKRALGQARGKAYEKLSELVQQGMPPQKAFLTFMNTPEGMDFVINDPDPTEAVKQFMTLATPDPVLAAREAAFGGAGGQTAPTTPVERGAALEAPGSETYVDPIASPNAGQQTDPTQEKIPAGPKVGEVDMSQLPPGVSPVMLRDGAFKLLKAGDEEGARLALTMAEQLDKQAEANAPPTTDELKEYDRYVAQEEKAGRTPMDWMDYKVKLASAGRNTDTPEESLRKQQTEGRIKVDVKAAEAAGEAALQITRALPALEEVERIGLSTPGGYKGALTPYLARVATSFGIEIPEEWSDAETINAISMQLVPLVRQPGQVSNYEQQTYMQAVPSLMQTPEGRMKIISMMKRQAQRAQEIAKVYRDNLGAVDLYEKIAELDKPMLTPEELEEFKRLGDEAAAAKGKEKPKEEPAAVDGAPSVGSIVDGHEFLGGDPAKPESWKKLEGGAY